MTLREFLEKRWADRRGHPISESLDEFSVPYGQDDADSIDWVGAERVADLASRMEGRIDPLDWPGAFWLDGFVAGAAFQRDARKAPPVRQPPTHICNSCGERIEYGDHAHGCPA